MTRWLRTAGRESRLKAFDTQTARLPAHEEDVGIRIQMSRTIAFVNRYDHGVRMQLGMDACSRGNACSSFVLLPA